ncbi:MAG: ATP-binding protein [Candidatus Krumholzibacteria bacterium]|nr:ATP-binding protein [Candidatus Krumholzibacteria bacterium]MDH4337127.1 ATP-binding protein [Candidatus Krumholzibacteria bacterium]MDH5271186.1 ATP-binding protein [Candidatus Krumholzibacteria bacterium]
MPDPGSERERLQHVAAQLKTLYHMGRDLGEDENWSDSLDRFLMALVSFLRAEGAALLLLSDRERSLAARARFHLDDELLVPAIATIRDAWQRHTRSAEIHSLESYSSARATSCLERSQPWRVTLIPLRHRGRSLGFLLLDKVYRGAAAFQDDYHFLSALQTIFAEEIANASYISELRQLSRFNNKVLDNIRSGVVTTDLEGNIRYVNALAGQMCPRVRRAGMQPAVHFDELFRLPMQESLFRRFLDAGEDADVLEVECHAGADAIIPVRLRLTRMHDDLLNGTVVVAIFDDLSEHKRMEEAIRRNDRLRSLGQLSASVAHEIRNPLAGIATTAEVLGEKLRGDESTTPYIHNMLDEISRLDGIVRNLLAFARPPRPQLAPCDARELIDRVFGMVAEQASARSVQISAAGAGPDRPCHADPAQLTQVLLNLALNAVQACGEGDRVTLDACLLRDEGGEWIEFSVVDTGPGVPQAVRGSLFEPFVTTKAQGTGLGLAICRQIVGDHRGSIACEFLDRGTRFAVRVPAWKDSAARARAAQPSHVQ